VSVLKDKNGISENKGKNCLDEMDGISCVKCLMWRTRTFVVENGWGDIYLVMCKDRVDVSSFLTHVIVQPLDRCVRQRLSINPTS
jgi:hypothetical protein